MDRWRQRAQRIMSARTLCSLLFLAATLLGEAGAQSQPLEWEGLPVIEGRAAVGANDVGFVTGASGVDRVIWFSSYGPLFYAPGEPGVWEGSDWINRCPGVCIAESGLVTPERTILYGAAVGPTAIDRMPDAGASRERDVNNAGGGTETLIQSSLPSLAGADGNGYIFAAIQFAFRSDDDGRPGSWVRLGNTGGSAVTLGEVPPSPMLPDGRLLAGVYNGVTYSDDGGLNWTPSTGVYENARYVGYSFAFVPKAGHAYGGTVLAGIDDLVFGRDSTATIYRSDDGGRTWTRFHRFSPTALGLSNTNEVHLLTSPDGVVWAGVSPSRAGRDPQEGVVVRSSDDGATWQLVDNGWGGYRAGKLRLGPDGRLYAATDFGVWRTTTPAYAVSSDPEVSDKAGTGLNLHVSPNPVDDRVAAVLNLDAPQSVEVMLYDSAGREVRRVWQGPAGDMQRIEVETSTLSTGVYSVQARTTEGEVAAARFTVVR